MSFYNVEIRSGTGFEFKNEFFTVTVETGGFDQEARRGIRRAVAREPLAHPEQRSQETATNAKGHCLAPSSRRDSVQCFRVLGGRPYRGNGDRRIVTAETSGAEEFDQQGDEIIFRFFSLNSMKARRLKFP